MLLVSSAGNETIDVKHPIEDTISPDGPEDAPITRSVGNNCRMLPAELPGVVSVTATGPVGYPGYTMNIASYSSVGGDIAAPGGDYFAASDTVQDAILGAMPANSSIFQSLDPLNGLFPGITTAARVRRRTRGSTAPRWPHRTSPAWRRSSCSCTRAGRPRPSRRGCRARRPPMACPPDWQPLRGR